MSAGVHNAWGVTCGMHHDPLKPKLACKRQLRGTDDATRRMLLAWLLTAAQVPADSINPREEHLSFKPRELESGDEEALIAERLRLFGS